MTCFLLFSGQWKYGGACQSTAGLQKEKRLAGPENAIARGKKKRKISSCGSGRKKKPCQTRKSRKNGSGRLIFTNQTRAGGKQVYITQKICSCGSERKKKPRQTRTLLCRQGRPQKYLRNGFVGKFYRWVPKRSEQTTTG